MGVRNIVDTVLKKATDSAKLFAAGLLVLCLMSIVISMFGVLVSGEGDVDMPNFRVLKEKFKTVGAEGLTMGEEEFLALKTKNSVKKKYAKKIEKLVKKRSLAEADASTITDQMIKVSEEHRSAYLSNLGDFIADIQKFNKKQKEDPSVDLGRAIDDYALMFEQALVDAEVARVVSLERRGRFLHVARESVTFLLFILAVALLLKIAGKDELPETPELGCSE